MYSPDLRERVIRFAKEKGPTEAARVFNMDRRTVYNWFKDPVPGKTGPKGARKLDVAKLNALLAEKNDRYQDELAELLGVCKATICKALKKQGWSRKKNQGSSTYVYTRTAGVSKRA